MSVIKRFKNDEIVVTNTERAREVLEQLGFTGIDESSAEYFIMTNGNRDYPLDEVYFSDDKDVWTGGSRDIVDIAEFEKLLAEELRALHGTIKVRVLEVGNWMDLKADTIYDIDTETQSVVGTVYCSTGAIIDGYLEGFGTNDNGNYAKAEYVTEDSVKKVKKQRKIVCVRITDVGGYFHDDRDGLQVGTVYAIDTTTHEIIGTCWSSSGRIYKAGTKYDNGGLDGFCGKVKAEYIKGYKFRNLDK